MTIFVSPFNLFILKLLYNGLSPKFFGWDFALLLYMNSKFRRFDINSFEIRGKIIKPEIIGIRYWSVEFFDEVNLYIAVLNPWSPLCPKSNIIAYNITGDKVWEISQPVLIPHGREDHFAKFHISNVKLMPYEDLFLHLSGHNVILDMRNGRTRFCDPKEAFFFLSKKINLPANVFAEKQFIFRNRHIILLSPRDLKIRNQNNVIAFDEQGNFQWQSQWEDNTKVFAEDSFNMLKIQNDKLVGYLETGHSALINHETGKANLIFI